MPRGVLWHGTGVIHNCHNSSAPMAPYVVSRRYSARINQLKSRGLLHWTPERNHRVHYWQNDKKLFILTKKWGFVEWIREYRDIFNRIFLIPVMWCVWAVLDTKSTITKTETLSTLQKCKDIKNLTMRAWSGPIVATQPRALRRQGSPALRCT